MKPEIVPIETGESNSWRLAALPLVPPDARAEPSPKVVRLYSGAELERLAPAGMSDEHLVKKLADSAIYREFRRTFEDATRLPLTLRSVKGWRLAHAGSRKQNGFCALMAQGNNSCSACLQLQQRVCEGVAGAPKTLPCVFGLSETAVGVEVGRHTIAYLQTGQVFFKPPTPRQTRRALQQIADWGLSLDAGEVARSYNATPVFRRREYNATMRLLQFFANQLGPLCSQIALLQETAEPEQIRRARDFIKSQYREGLTLGAVARHAGMGLCHFCRTFKKVTGMHYNHYLSRIRVEAAKNLLLNRDFRVTEICYEVGFQSLTHFNRVFRKIVGESPTEYRRRFAQVVEAHL